MLKLSLIIPVYNEERHIRACLEAVAAQLQPFDEVIVVDNNCSDGTISIAEEFAFVSVVKEKNQGRGHARDAGFRAASGDILGRIDADSRIPPDWSERVRQRFTRDLSLAGLTGIAYTDAIPYLHRPKTTLFARAYYWFAHADFGTVTMWGATMAVRRDAWLSVANKLNHDDRQMHEDQDLSLHMASRGARIAVDNSLRITTNGQTYRYLPKLLSYIRLQRSTKRLHRQAGTFHSRAFSRLGFWRTLPGRLMALPVGLYLILCGLLPLPVDLIVVKLLGHKLD